MPSGGLASLRSELAGISTGQLIGAGAAVLGAGAITAGAIAYAKRRKRKSGKGRKKSPRRSSSGRYRRGTSRARASRSGPRKTRNRRGGAVRDRYKGKKVYRTKRGQPYILKANGQARFVRA